MAQNKSAYHKGWSILIYHTGIPGESPKCMMIVKGTQTVHFNGYVANEDEAIESAKQQIDYLEEKDEPDADDWGDGEFEFTG